MTSKKAKLPSIAQAKLIAGLWASNKVINVGGYEPSTIIACVKYRWLVPNGETGTYPNGTHFVTHAISTLGVDALESFLRDQRQRKAFA